MLNVFTDFHHAGLLHSFILLFEKRFNGRVYRPIGRDWYDKGYWKVYDHPHTVAQFLDIGGANPDGTDPVNEIVEKSGDNVYKCQDIDSGLFNRAITYDGFMATDFKFVIATIPQHLEPFRQLCELHPSKPKLIYQLGNAWTVEAGLAPNVMASAMLNGVLEHINFISYHQEFDLRTFRRREVTNKKNIYSFVNVFDKDRLFEQDWELFKKIERLMPCWSFKAYGGQCRDGAMHGSKQVADAMADSRFIWHTKNGGDGYGHVIHNIPAIGRPMIVKAQYYKGKFAESLIKDGKTAIVIDNLNPAQIVEKINYYNKPIRYFNLCDKAFNNFKQSVNFDIEAEKIRKFLDNAK